MTPHDLPGHESCATPRRNPCGGPPAFVAKLSHDTDDIKRLYYELLLAVENKYEGESRHETALRLIKQAQKAQAGTATATRGKKSG